MNAKKISAVLAEVGILFELKGENTFKVRAFSNAARVLKESTLGTSELVEEVNAGKIKGIGKQLAEDINTIYKSGTLPLRDELKAEFPETLFDLLKINGLGAKKVKKLYEELDITSIPELEKACTNHTIAELKGFGKKSEEKILLGIEQLKKYQGLFRIDIALSIAEEIVKTLQESTLVDKVEIAGSIRRAKEIIKDIDIVAVSTKPKELIEFFSSLSNIESVTAQGDTKCSVLLKEGIAVDLRVVQGSSFASALQYFTGSKEHNTLLRGRAQKQGYKLNEYGLFREEKPEDLDTEEEIFEHLGLSYIPPELREGLSEIDSEIPNLVIESDIKGVLHAHSTYSDGVHTLRELATAIRNMGYEYLGITDHSQSAAYAGGLSIDSIKKQHKEIDKLNKELKPFHIFKGIESDILKDGSLDYPDEILKTFDFVIASVHSSFSMPEEEMTQRILTAIRNPYTTILGHPTGRRLLIRDGYSVDLKALIKEAANNHVAIEINANPQRLDLDWRFVKVAKELGVKIPICPDAHSIEDVNYTQFGIGVARKGWLTKDDVLNSLSLDEVNNYFLNKHC